MLVTPPELVLDSAEHSVGHGHAAFTRIIAPEEPPTAMLTANDRLALGGLRRCQENGVAVPRDIAVFGFDNIEYASIPLSIVDYPAEDLARQAVTRLMALIGSWNPLPPPELVCIQPALVLRESTGFASRRWSSLRLVRPPVRSVQGPDL